MNLSRLCFLPVVMFSLWVMPGTALPADDQALFQKGVNAGISNQTDFAFSYFDMIVKNHRGSRYYPQALFSSGEYFFRSRAFRDAKHMFRELSNDYSDSELRPFALAYLLRLAKQEGKRLEAKELEKEIVKARQVCLVFKDFKEYSFTSPLNIIYKAQFFIDKVEVYINGRLFEEIPF